MSETGQRTLGASDSPIEDELEDAFTRLKAILAEKPADVYSLLRKMELARFSVINDLLQVAERPGFEPCHGIVAQ